MSNKSRSRPAPSFHVFDISLERILGPIMHLSTLTKVITIGALMKLITIEYVLSYYSPHNFASL